MVSLFTNVPIDLALKSIKLRWKFIRNNTRIPVKEVLNAIEFVLSSTYFSFNGKTYKQIFGVLMSSPLSPIIAGIVMQDLEKSILRKLPFNSSFYFRYVDNIILTAPPDYLDDLLLFFNNYNNRLQFTSEIQNNNTLSFLDTLLITSGNKIIFN